MELVIDKVSMRFKDKKAVSNISLKLTPGVWGLLGANGAGKTTLMRIIAGILKPTSGQVLYDGVPIRTLGEEYRALFGYLPQEFGFPQEFTVKDYLIYVAALKGMTKRQGRKRIHELLEQVSLLEVRNRKIARLSGGMKRRVGIAQALLNDPEVLVLDEPTGGLDPGERVRFRNLLSEFAHDRIVLISTHIVPDVEYIAGCHAMIREGKLLATGTTEELVRLWRGRCGPAPFPPRRWRNTSADSGSSAFGMNMTAACPSAIWRRSPVMIIRLPPFPGWRICICGCFLKAAGRTEKRAAGNRQCRRIYKKQHQPESSPERILRNEEREDASRRRGEEREDAELKNSISPKVAPEGFYGTKRGKILPDAGAKRGKMRNLNRRERRNEDITNGVKTDAENKAYLGTAVPGVIAFRAAGVSAGYVLLQQLHGRGGE